jgi:hypothetical protein
VKNCNPMRYPLALDMSPYLESYVPPAGASLIAEQQLSNIVESLTAAASSAKEEEKSKETAEKEKEPTKGKQPAGNNPPKGKKGKKKEAAAHADTTAASATESAPAQGSNPDEKLALEIGPIDQFGDSIYNLFSVVIHRGGNAGFGHYHAYIRDVAQQVEAQKEEKTPKMEADKKHPDVTTAEAEPAKEMKDAKEKEKEKVDEEKVRKQNQADEKSI